MWRGAGGEEILFREGMGERYFCSEGQGITKARTPDPKIMIHRMSLGKIGNSSYTESSE